MGCGGSKGATAHVMTSEGMGNVGRAWDEMMASKPAKVRATPTEYPRPLARL